MAQGLVLEFGAGYVLSRKPETHQEFLGRDTILQKAGGKVTFLHSFNECKDSAPTPTQLGRVGRLEVPPPRMVFLSSTELLLFLFRSLITLVLRPFGGERTLPKLVPSSLPSLDSHTRL